MDHGIRCLIVRPLSSVDYIDDSGLCETSSCVVYIFWGVGILTSPAASLLVSQALLQAWPGQTI